jgi:NDP-sugar pyrophosphorylase family protein
MNGDSFCDVDLLAIWAIHQARNAYATLLLARVSDTDRYGRVEVDENGLVGSFDEKGEKTAPGWINAGIYFLRRQFVLTIQPNRRASLEREIFPAWIGRGLYACPTNGHFLDIGTPESYASAERFFSKRESL